MQLVAVLPADHVEMVSAGWNANRYELLKDPLSRYQMFFIILVGKVT